ncbi:hypothetical protein CHARACLAT_002814 [Characodon lateralis]|uniref:Uncharacterized protein n=1 Tax=Characodon lateralis TaxID=208331 RepID=A0ABU7DDS7_9TELE|nr:hypothetical protein [Characodon lateralis]
MLGFSRSKLEKSSGAAPQKLDLETLKPHWGHRDAVNQRSWTFGFNSSQGLRIERCGAESRSGSLGVDFYNWVKVNLLLLPSGSRPTKIQYGYQKSNLNLAVENPLVFRLEPGYLGMTTFL